MTAVAVWPERPSAAALLAARLDAGWTATPTRLVDGARVLGYAACRIAEETTIATDHDRTGEAQR